jgi:amino acid permease
MMLDVVVVMFFRRSENKVWLHYPGIFSSLLGIREQKRVPPSHHRRTQKRRNVASFLFLVALPIMLAYAAARDGRSG